ncbi:Two component regulator propeller [Cnuella takakiae]|uniref:Two component regulator propeller n=1 Tax=Cnuella takakiae TaxID=1302690 RepID=A0A1M4X1Q5_9BACT|nr:triple tyrosine motif-containing protein [Cnuella takakiae]OLY91563.1 hypothetical protein BUE76_06325 [Cnuella takakiae]SHE87317.1 Two component regulator propeller [Cnuella takakiae]
MLRKLLAFILVTWSATAIAQNTIGLPVTDNFDKNIYNAGAQNREIAQDANGIMYFANNEGLLCFDGTYWKLYPLPNKTIVRSVAIAPDGKIYVGGQDEIGYFSPDAAGRLSFTSLIHIVPRNHRPFADVWNIQFQGNHVFFRTSNKIFRLQNGSMSVFPSKNGWGFIGSGSNKVYAYDLKAGFFQWDGSQWQHLNLPEPLTSELRISAFTSCGADSMIITTVNKGMLLLTPGKIAPFTLKQARFPAGMHFTTAVRLDGETMALGSSANGCYIVRMSGEVIQNFSRETGLQNNRITNLFQDANKNIWVGLEGGIDFIAYNNAIKKINPAVFNDGSGYAALVYANQLYLGLSNGLYRLELPKLKDYSFATSAYHPVAGAEGQVYGLGLFGNLLLLGGHDGLFSLKGTHAVPIAKGTGYWTFQPYQNTNGDSQVLAGNYHGISLFNTGTSAMASARPIPAFDESARFLVVDNENRIWASHPYQGIYLFEGPDQKSRKLYTSKDGLPSSLDNHVFKVKGRMVVATIHGIYEYDPAKDRFEPSEYFRPVFGTTSVRYLKEDAAGNIWFIHEKSVGVADFSTLKPKIIYLPELNRKIVSGYEHIYPINQNNILVGAEKGFYHINYEQYKSHTHSLNVLIRSVEAIGKTDTLLYGGYNSAAGKKVSKAELEHNRNSFHFSYSAPFYEQQANIEYAFQLEGLDKGWSEWSKKTEKEYTALPAGSYTFKVKARNNLGNESTVSSYSFVVLPPWYATAWAFAAYFILACLGAFLLYKRQQKRFLRQQQKHSEEQEHLQYLHQLEIDKNEKEIVKLKNEKLEAEIEYKNAELEYKNSELASIAMHLVQKGELLTKIKDELQRLNKNPKHLEPLNDLKKVIRILSDEEKLNEDWEQFAVHFNKVHNDFLLMLKERYPDLKPHELKLCAYLRMNLSSKEIAQLMNISVRGVEIGRYRLRKKLQLATEVNLSQFMLSLEIKKGPHAAPDLKASLNSIQTGSQN